MSLTEYSTNLSARFLFDSMEAFKKKVYHFPGVLNGKILETSCVVVG
jgi:hypothetical protein